MTEQLVRPDPQISPFSASMSPVIWGWGSESCACFLRPTLHFLQAFLWRSSPWASVHQSFEACGSEAPALFASWCLLAKARRPMKANMKYYLSHKCYRYFLLVWRITLKHSKARTVTHNNAPVLHTNIVRELLPLSVIVLGNKAHETSASWDYTLSGYTPYDSISVKMACKTPDNYTTAFWGT